MAPIGNARYAQLIEIGMLAMAMCALAAMLRAMVPAKGTVGQTGQAEAGAAYVVHGFGTGAVRRAVRERLKEHPLVAEWRPGGPGEGGDGASVVRLK